MEPTPVAVVVEAPCCSFSEIMAIIGAVSTLIAGPLLGLVMAIRGIRKTQGAQAVIANAQQNRYLESRGAEPVTMASPPTGTGDGGIDKEVMRLLTAAEPHKEPPAAVVVAQPPGGGLTEAQEERLAAVERALAQRAGPPPTPGG